MVSDEYANLIGMTPEEAEKETGLRIRVTSADGNFFMVTQDYCIDRLNVGTTDGVISSVSDFG